VPSWVSKDISPFAVFVTVLVVLATVAAVTMILVTRMEPPEVRGVLPFPKNQLDYYRLDEIAGHIHHPDYRRWHDWPEHHDGGFEMATNNLGFREDGPTAVEKPGGVVRILVTGDSHTDGVVANSESFANQLEDLMNARQEGGAEFEIINGGHGHYGPHNYLGILRRHLDLELDHFVVVLFVGNDLLDAVADAWFRKEFELPDRPDWYIDRLEKAQALSGAAVAQGLNQAYLFRTLPEVASLSLEITEDQFRQISALCDEHGIGFYTVLLPAKINLEPEIDAETTEAVDVLGLSAADLNLNQELASALAESLESFGIQVLDLQPGFGATSEVLYWKSDHHLNVEGHRLAAELFAERFGEQLQMGDSVDR